MIKKVQKIIIKLSVLLWWKSCNNEFLMSYSYIYISQFPFCTLYECLTVQIWTARLITQFDFVYSCEDLCRISHTLQHCATWCSIVPRIPKTTLINSFSKTGCFTKVKESILPYYIPIAEGKRDWCLLDKKGQSWNYCLAPEAFLEGKF